MSKVLRGFLFGLIVIAFVLAPACKPKKVVTDPRTQTATTTETGPPQVTMTVPQTTTVAPPEDFVREDPKPSVDVLPNDIEEANRLAQSRGLIRDAFFGYDEAGLSGDAQDALRSSADWLRRNPQYNLLVEGHCDERGTEQYNLALGDRRANTVKDYLATLGVEPGRIRTVSYGEERPFDDGHDESAWAKNRRGHLVLVGGR